MELEILRMYHEKGTNGILRVNGRMQCYTIELPWKDNKRNQSCIPEGRYLLEKRFSDRFMAHILVKDVPNRSLILIHSANDAATELKGCIAPVTALTGNGKGDNSREALKALRKLVYDAFTRNEPVWLTIEPLDAPTPTSSN